MQKSKGNLDCLFVRNNLFTYQEKQFSGLDRKKFEDHLNLCEECSRIVSDFQSVTSLIDHKKSVEVNAFFHTRTLQYIETELNQGNRIPNHLFKRILQPVLMSFLFLSAILIGLLIGKQFGSNYPQNTARQYVIETMKSDLFITDFMDEDKIAINNR